MRLISTLVRLAQRGCAVRGTMVPVVANRRAVSRHDMCLPIAHRAGFSTSTNQALPKNFVVVNDMAQYERIAYGPTGLGSNEIIVTFFTAGFSTWGKILSPQFVKLAEETPNLRFLAIDTENCPRAAYHADVDAVPTIVVMYGDDAFRAKVAPKDHVDCSDMITRAKEAINEAVAAVANSKVPIRSTRSWYTHNIDIDNTNIYRTGWIEPIPSQQESSKQE